MHLKSYMAIVIYSCIAGWVSMGSVVGTNRWGDGIRVMTCSVVYLDSSDVYFVLIFWVTFFPGRSR